MDRWGRDDEHTRTFDLVGLRDIPDAPRHEAPESAEGRPRVVEIDVSRCRPDPRRE